MLLVKQMTYYKTTSLLDFISQKCKTKIIILKTTFVTPLTQDIITIDHFVKDDQDDREGEDVKDEEEKKEKDDYNGEKLCRYFDNEILALVNPPESILNDVTEFNKFILSLDFQFQIDYDKTESKLKLDIGYKDEFLSFVGLNIYRKEAEELEQYIKIFYTKQKKSIK